MPYLIAHPAAVVPLRPHLGRLGVLSALVIGSIAPDLWYFAPSLVSRAETHSATALLWFCLPVGMAIYTAYQVFFRHPLLGLLPRALSCRLATTDGFAPVSWLAVTVSILVGSATHFVWDAFTHGKGVAVQALPILRIQLAAIGSYELYVYTLLQHGSTFLGVSLLAWWIARWWRSSATTLSQPPLLLSPAQRIWVFGFLVAASIAAAALSAAAADWKVMDGAALRVVLRQSAFAGLTGFLLGLSLYSLLWHFVFRSRDHRWAPWSR